jgi:hypothetical protein
LLKPLANKDSSPLALQFPDDRSHNTLISAHFECVSNSGVAFTEDKSAEYSLNCAACSFSQVKDSQSHQKPSTGGVKSVHSVQDSIRHASNDIRATDALESANRALQTDKPNSHYHAVKEAFLQRSDRLAQSLVMLERLVHSEYSLDQIGRSLLPIESRSMRVHAADALEGESAHAHPIVRLLVHKHAQTSLYTDGSFLQSRLLYGAQMLQRIN